MDGLVYHWACQHIFPRSIARKRIQISIMILRPPPIASSPTWRGWTYRAASGVVVAALASDLEGNIVGGVALDLDGAGGQVVEVLVEELDSQVRTVSPSFMLFPMRGKLGRQGVSFARNPASSPGADARKTSPRTPRKNCNIHRSPPWRYR